MKKNRNFRRMMGYVKPYWGSVVANFILNIFSVIFSLLSFTMIVPFLNLLFNPPQEVMPLPEFGLDVKSIEGILDHYLSFLILTKGPNSALLFICCLVVAAFFLRNLTTYMGQYYIANVRVNPIRDLRNDLYHKILILPLAFYSKHKKGDIIARVTTDLYEIEVSVMNYIDVFIKNPITIIGYFLYMLFVSWQLTVFVLVVLPIAGLVIGAIGKSLKKDSKEAQWRLGGIISTLEESISGLRIIKAFNAIGYSKRAFNEQNDKYARLLRFVSRKRELSSPMSEFLSAAVICVVLWFGGRLILGGAGVGLDAASFIAYVAVFSQIISPVKAISQGYYNVQKGLAAVDRVFEVLDAEEVIVEKENPVSISDFKDEIKYDNVTFGYGNGDVLKDINLTIKKGKMIALVGESGGGKSTMADLLPRFYDVCDGSVTVDGIDIREYRISDLRGMMGIVTQESILFNDTVFNNIAFGMESASMEDVIAAAKVANAHEFIMNLENGYDTVIGDRGMTLSGGQRQRISIARAVLKNPPVLILDEATAALDTESERLVQDALAKVMSNRTSIVIAHRLSTIQNADEIVVLVKGQIVERGTHTELLAKGGVYRHLTQMQSIGGV
ncbi:MAG: ABC transporter ATP-binding protein/permease [Bacteroidales bacterium]|nr:ABC transporter ATP-binding protein/permease [Bacteroidales bacterium]